MTKLIKTESEILNLVLKSLYVNQVWEEENGYREIELPKPDRE
ncbi:MAG: hypothetical protein ACE5QW_04965 [Thermoplasmata archaeon]